MTKTPLTPVQMNDFEMSRFISSSKIHSNNATEKAFTATDEECVALAKRFNVQTVHSFAGKVQMIYIKADKTFAVTGHFTADVTQECRTTFKPVRQTLDDTFKELLVVNAEDLPALENLHEHEQAVELLEGDTIDYGEIATQWLSLALDPYPRTEGEVFEHVEYVSTETNPFSALKEIKLENNQEK